MTISTWKERDNWIRQLLASEMPPIAKVVGTRLALYLNMETGRLDPTQFAIAKDTGTTDRNVRRGIAKLVARGWLAKTRRGSERSDFYRLKTPRPDESVQSECGRPDKTGKSDRTNPSSRKANRKADRDCAQERANSPSHAPYGARGKEKEKANTKSAAVGTFHRAFDWLWKEYDRGYLDDPEPARQAFMAACQAGNDPEAILRGAKAYMDGKEPGYRKKLEDWLGRRGWTKAPPKPKSASTRTFNQKTDPARDMLARAQRAKADRLAREAAAK
jgi:hypothetical protein